MTIKTLALVAVILAIINNTASAETQQITLMCSGVSKRPSMPMGDPDPRLQQRLAGVTITVSQENKEVTVNGDYFGDIRVVGANEIIFGNPNGSTMPIHSDHFEGRLDRITGHVDLHFSLGKTWIEYWSLECRRTQPLF